MAFERFKKIFKGKAGSPKPDGHAPSRVESDEQKAPAAKSQKRKKQVVSRRMLRAPGSRRLVRSDSSPYTIKPGLQKETMARLTQIIHKNAGRLKTDRFTLLEIADQILSKEIGLPRPQLLRAHHVFAMFLKVVKRAKSAAPGACHEWQGAYKGGAPVVTTVNAQRGHRLQVDARKYVLENPVRGKRRNFRSIPENSCGNDRCVNPRHIRMVPSNPLSHQGENHPRSKFTDKDVVRMVKEYNAGATAREIAKKWKIQMTYVEQIMRKEKRTEATEGMTIRGRFGSR